MSVVAANHPAASPPELHVFLAAKCTVGTDCTSTISSGLLPLIHDGISVLMVLFPVIAIFRIVYRFAEHREGNLTVLVTEIVVIVFVALVVGFVLQSILP